MISLGRLRRLEARRRPARRPARAHHASAARRVLRRDRRRRGAALRVDGDARARRYLVAAHGGGALAGMRQGVCCLQ